MLAVLQEWSNRWRLLRRLEVHNDPAHALCDGPQALTPERFAEVTAGVAKIREAVKGA